mmetsp:Transcript_14946/g.17462  ORF Transcript_14946/g.17462 Transcript_14946/m.17462 type:complete len:141 (+) Transcript_14946:793-1215(+)
MVLPRIHGNTNVFNCPKFSFLRAWITSMSGPRYMRFARIAPRVGATTVVKVSRLIFAVDKVVGANLCYTLSLPKRNKRKQLMLTVNKNEATERRSLEFVLKTNFTLLIVLILTFMSVPWLLRRDRLFYKLTLKHLPRDTF